MRIFVTSDLHADFKENWDLLESLDGACYRDAALIVAGDVGHRLHTIRATLSLLRSKFQRVFYMPGNHELWVRGETGDSIEKLHHVLDLCDELDVETRPARVGGYRIVPLFSWYDDSLDSEEPADPAELEGWGDFAFCRWPAGLGNVSEHFAEMNRSRVRAYDDPVLSFSHFLPRRDLLPDTTRLRFKGLPKVAGCDSLERQVRALGSSIHVFGHSHINCDRVIEGVRYVQNAILYPKERQALRSAGRQFWKSGNPLLHLVTA
jgi:hypothetical protein